MGPAAGVAGNPTPVSNPMPPAHSPTRRVPGRHSGRNRGQLLGATLRDTLRNASRGVRAWRPFGGTHASPVYSLRQAASGRQQREPLERQDQEHSAPESASCAHQDERDHQARPRLRALSPLRSCNQGRLALGAAGESRGAARVHVIAGRSRGPDERDRVDLDLSAPRQPDDLNGCASRRMVAKVSPVHLVYRAELL
jgi:hypothetical protein